jgi:ankyrin repeat protein
LELLEQGADVNAKRVVRNIRQTSISRSQFLTH